MKSILPPFFAALLLPAQSTERQGPIPPIPETTVSWTGTSIAVDGELREAAWAQAPVLELGFPWDSQQGAKQKTRVRLLWDDKNLYLGYECEDADITAQHEKRDDPTYTDDAVEAFINPRPEQTDVYLGFEMNARAVMYDYVYFQTRYLFKRLNLEGIVLATKLDGTLNARGDSDKGWTLEVSIPFAEFQPLAQNVPPKPGDRWALNLNRWDGVQPDRRLSMWSDSGLARPNPHNPKRFGVIRFVK
jgi:Carbohydrate family 9 binding domain-like